jgi:hypothetical protein
MGRFAVADGDTREVRLFTEDGHHVRTIGRRGRGPGEFEALSFIGTRNTDTIVIWDVATWRITTLDSALRLTSTTTLARADSLHFPPKIIGAFDDGSVVAAVPIDLFALRNAAPGDYQQQQTYQTYRADGTPGIVLTALPGPERVLFNEGATWGIEEVIFGRYPIATVHHNEFVGGLNGTSTLAALNAEGDTLRSYRVPHEPIRVDVSDVAARRAERISREQARRTPAGIRGFQRMRDAAISRIQEVPARETLPVYDDLKVDSDGNLWVATYPRPVDTEQRWYVFGRNGRLIASVYIPVSLQVLDVGRDRVLALTRDELDVETVAIYLLTKPE